VNAALMQIVERFGTLPQCAAIVVEHLGEQLLIVVIGIER
jgi:hypothetical protein